MNKSRSIYKIIIPIIEINCLVILLWSYLFSETTMMVVFILLGIMGFYTSLYISKKKILDNIYNLVPGLGCLYLLTYPFFKYVLKIFSSSFRGITESGIIKSTELGGCFLLLFCFVASFNQQKVQKENSTVLFYQNISISIRNIIIDIAFMIFFVISLYLYRSIGGFRAIISGIASRGAVSQTFADIPGYSYLEFAFISYTVYTIFAFRNKKIINYNRIISIIRIAIVGTYWLMQLLVGNRRSFVCVLMGIILYYITSPDRKRKSDKIKKPFIFIGGGILLVFLLYISVLRNNVSLTSEMRLRDMFGEFIYPMVTNYFYASQSNVKFLHGSSYLMIFVMLIPRFLWTAKPLALGIQFMRDYGTTMGYAYTPYTEMYRNFGIAGPLFGIVIYQSIFLWITRNREKYPILYLIMYMELINIFRGQFATTFVEILIMYSTFKLLYIINTPVKKTNRGIKKWIK